MPDTRPASDFASRLHGSFVALLKWEQFDQTWQALAQRANEGWYVYAIGEAPPETPASPEAFRRFLDEISELLHREHEHDYCGIVYVDDREKPELVKIYDPNNLGVVCGYSESPPLPGWVISRLKPTPIETPAPPAGNRRRWWQRLFGK